MRSLCVCVCAFVCVSVWLLRECERPRETGVYGCFRMLGFALQQVWELFSKIGQLCEEL